MSPNLERYIYGVINVKEGNAFFPLTTDRGEEVHLVNYNEMGCAVKDAVHQDYLTMGKEGIATNLVAHQTVIEKVMKSRTIIPMKFGTFLQDDTEVLEMLEKGENLFSELLNEMDGKIELDVAASWNDLNSVIKEIGATNEDIIKRKQEIAENPPEDMFQAKLEVGALVKTVLDEKRQGLQNEIIARLSDLSLAHQTHDLMEDKMILNCAFLIPQEKEEAFDKLLHELDEKYGGKLDFRCVGPLPPYSFGTCEVKPIDFAEIDKARRLLGLKDRATVAEIKAAYRSFIKTKHPDQSGDTEAQKRFEEIKWAYQTLLDFCSEGEVSFRPEDINGTFIVRRFDVAGTRTFNR
ncbi:GvpL/GvpF family gas vesicle protein [Acidobacteria bacterium AH-259-O06]|nr:GvpL/GvpF family gas vesicle protein [Acidobacteria bacterium AH-259-O06]